jgi:hypothetical protein
MDRALHETVWRRAGSRCEYCRIHQDDDIISFQIDHVFAISHGGPTRASNLALACHQCNHFKGPNLAGLDPGTRRVTRLFHPRRHRWHKHFGWDGAVLVGLTDVGRTTAVTLRINLLHRVAQRRVLIAAGLFPPR